VQEEILDRFMQESKISDRTLAEDEFIYENSYALNKKYYASLGEKKAFVLSHGKDMMVLKIVGLGDQVIRYYRLEELKAHVWIGHHRYPTKGRVWHPGGAHPFVGLHEALVHNGDFSNYHSITEYLAQRNTYPLFLTDTEVAVYLFDLWRRTYNYPIELVIEAMAPTTERDFYMLPEEKRGVYREIQKVHIHGSPDGPWFFIIGRSEENASKLHLLGITDTSMLRPQVFALQEGAVKIGLIASERQAIDACLKSLASEDSRFAAKADRYWNARGGSHTDGGAFIFTVDRTRNEPTLTCTDKFGQIVTAPAKRPPREIVNEIVNIIPNTDKSIVAPSLDALRLEYEASARKNVEARMHVIRSLTLILDRLHTIPSAMDGRIRATVEASLFNIFRTFPSPSQAQGTDYSLISSSNQLRTPDNPGETLLIDVSNLSAEGEGSASELIVAAYKHGWRHVISFDWQGQRFCGVGLGENSNGFRLDVYGNPGDYLGSGVDGAEIYVHASAQDQVAQIMKSGKLVIYGDVGQTFMYGAKGGDVYVLGNAAGRPLINAAGQPRVVINGTCLDYLAESFMAGDPLKGGGFVIVNGIRYDAGEMVELETPYPGSNLFSLASGGAIYLRDPNRTLSEDQLNGGQITTLEHSDWKLISPYLQENERLFDIKLEDLLKIHGETTALSSVYRKIDTIPLKRLASVEG